MISSAYLLKVVAGRGHQVVHQADDLASKLADLLLDVLLVLEESVRVDNLAFAVEVAFLETFAFVLILEIVKRVEAAFQDVRVGSVQQLRFFDGDEGRIEQRRLCVNHSRQTHRDYKT